MEFIEMIDAVIRAMVFNTANLSDYSGDELAYITKLKNESSTLTQVGITIFGQFPWLKDVIDCTCRIRDIDPVQVATLQRVLDTNMGGIYTFQNHVFEAFVAVSKTVLPLYNDGKIRMLTRNVSKATAFGIVTLVLRLENENTGSLIHAFEHFETEKIPATELETVIQSGKLTTKSGKKVSLVECIPELEGLKIRVHMEKNGTLIYTHKGGLITDPTELLTALGLTASTGTAMASKMLKELCEDYGSVGIVLVSPEHTRLKSCVIENANTPSKAYITSAFTPLGEVLLRKAGSLKTVFEATQVSGYTGYTAYMVSTECEGTRRHMKLMAMEHSEQFDLLKPYGNDGVLPLSEVARRAIATGKAKEYELIMNPQLVAEFQSLCNELTKDRPEELKKLREFISANHAELYKADSELCKAVGYVAGADGKAMLKYIQGTKVTGKVAPLGQLLMNMKQKAFWTATGVDAKKSVEAKMLDAMKKIREGVNNEKIKEITRDTLKATLAKATAVPVMVPAKATADSPRVAAAKALLAVAEAKAALAVALAEAENAK